MPLSIGGVLLGALVLAPSSAAVNLAGLLFVCGQVALTIGLTWAAIRLAIAAVAPRLVQAAAPANLRTE
jgi:enamine deaminase RidA (YjgF/YER057c/UK114 family)